MCVCVDGFHETDFSENIQKIKDKKEKYKNDFFFFHLKKI